MPYQPTFPYPYLEAIDVGLEDGNDFKCLINSRDIIQKYIVTIMSALDSSVVCTIKGEFYSGNFKKYKKVGSGAETEISPIPNDDSALPLKGSPSDNSWLQVNIPQNMGMINGQNYKWNITLFEEDRTANGVLPTLKITEGKIVSYVGDTTKTIELRPNSNIKEGMYVGCKGELRKITTWNSSTNKAVLDIAFSISPTTSDTNEVYSTFITSNDYFFKARALPTVVFNVPDEIDSSEHTFAATYSQAENVGVSYYKFDLYLGSQLVKTTGEVYSSDVEFSYDGFLTGNAYEIVLTIATDDGFVMDEISEKFDVVYSEMDSYITPIVSADNFKTCINVDFSRNIDIVGHLEGSQDIILGKFKNPLDDVPENNNGLMLSRYQDLYWDKVNEIKPLEIPSEITFFYHTNCGLGYKGKLFEIIDESGVDFSIEVGYDGKRFYCVMGAVDTIYSNPYIGGEASAIIPSGQSTTIDETKYYIINGADTIKANDQIIYNDLANKYWWKITVRPYADTDSNEDVFTVTKGEEFSGSVVV